jgi:hypothetical protein
MLIMLTGLAMADVVQIPPDAESLEIIATGTASAYTGAALMFSVDTVDPGQPFGPLYCHLEEPSLYKFESWDASMRSSWFGHANGWAPTAFYVQVCDLALCTDTFQIYWDAPSDSFWIDFDNSTITFTDYDENELSFAVNLADTWYPGTGFQP